MPETAPQEDEIFEIARKLSDSAERRAYLDAVCSGSFELRGRVENLLKADAQADSFFAATSTALSQCDFVLPVTEVPGDRIGRYKLLQKIGEGGCGMVYMAEQEQPVRRRVALKLIKLGMDTRNVIARFEAERQALAIMDHPNIATVYDGGATEAGRPYFVMELVRGTSITQYADHNHLTTRQRLKLFLQVCNAVQHAHQKGIIHRDLKPSNILVTTNDGVPVPKIIDFGIAKAIEGRLTDQTVFTAFEQFIGTPAYVSPEQATMTSVDIDTRTDIYSLGVLFYELLTGKTPFDTSSLLAAGLDEFRLTIREKEPLRPSTRLRALPENELSTMAANRLLDPLKLISVLRGDLDWIAMKCLDKDRARRYQTANDLALDIEHYLHGEPVTARPPSSSYRMQKFARRNKLALVAAAGLVSTLILATVVSTREAFRARHAELRQEQLNKNVSAEAARAHRAEEALQEQLANSYSAQAQATRWSRRVGRRFDSLELIQKAAAIRPSLELRNEAIACMALTDIREIKGWGKWTNGAAAMAFDGPLGRGACLDKDGTLHIFRASDRFELMQLPGYQSPLRQCVFSHTGEFLAISCGPIGERLEIIDLKTGQVILKRQKPQLRILDFAGDDRLIAISYEDPEQNFPVLVYELATGKLLNTFPTGLLRSDRLLYDLRFNPVDSDRLLTSNWTPTVRVWDWKTGMVIREFEHPDWVQGVAWHPDGEIVASTCADGSVRLWKMSTGTQLATLSGHEWSVVAVSFNPEGNFLLSKGWEGTIHLWDTYSKADLLRMPVWGVTSPFSDKNNRFATLEEDKTFTLREVHAGLGYLPLIAEVASPEVTVYNAFSADSQWLFSTGDRSARVWDARSGKILASQAGGYNGVFPMIDPKDGKLYLCGEPTAEVYRIERDPDRLELKRESTHILSSEQMPFRLPADGSRFSGRTLGLMRFLRLPQPPEPILLSGPGDLRFIEFSPDCTYAAAWANISTNLQIWNLRTGKLTHEFPTEVSTCAMFSPDGTKLIAGDQFQYRCWATTNWAEDWSVPRKISNYGYLAFSPDSRIVALSLNRSAVTLASSDSGSELARLESPEGASKNWMTFSPDGSKLAMTGAGPIELWDLKKIRAELAALKLDWE